MSPPRANGVTAADDPRPTVPAPGATLAPSSKLSTGAAIRYVHRVHSILRSGIRTGRIGVGTRLDEALLARNLQTSRNAIREALHLLADEGLVTRVRGRGTTVTGCIMSSPIDHLWSTDFEQAMNAIDVEVIHLARGVVRLGTSATTQLLQGHTEMFLIEDLVTEAGDAIALRSIYVPLDPDPELLADHVDDLPESYESIYGVRLERIVCTVQAVACDDRTSALLRVPAGVPVLLREIAFHDAPGALRLTSFQIYRADRVSLEHVTTFT